MADGAAATALTGPVAMPDPYASDLTPWLLRRLQLADAIALQLRDEARQALAPPAAR